MTGPNILAQRVVSAGQVYELRGSQVAEAIGGSVFTVMALDAASGRNLISNMVGRQGGKLYCRNGQSQSPDPQMRISEYDPDTGTWVNFLAGYGGLPRPTGENNQGWTSVTGSDGEHYLVAWFVDDFDVLVWDRIDSEGNYANFRVGSFFTVQSGGLTAPFTWKNQAWAQARQGAFKDVDKFQSFNPATGAQTLYSVPAGTPSSVQRAVFFSVDDRLFVVWAQDNNGTSNVYEFKFGTWQDTGLDVFFQTRGTGGGFGTAFFHNDSAYLFVRLQSGGPITTTEGGIQAWRFFVNTPGGALQQTQITNPVIPPSMRSGSNTVLNSFYYGLWSFVDDQTDPANPVPYIIFCPDMRSASTATMFRFVDDTSELAVAANMPTTSEYAYPDTYWGSGPFLNGIETANAKLVTGQVVSGIKGSQGMELRSRLYGDPLVVPHGAISPGGGAAQFDVGETLTSSSGGSATILESKPTTGEVRLFDVTGTFLNGDTLTMTTGPNSGANATQSAASSGGLADKTVRFRYFLDNTRTLGVPATGICTLVPGSNNKGSIVGNEVQGLIAEYLLGINPGTIDVEWDFLTDGVAEAAVAAVKLEVVRP